jgi:surface carbohydrate biosynthesis protein
MRDGANYKILFPIETTARELCYKLLLSIKFAELGYECYLGSKDEINQLIGAVKPFAYFDKGYHINTSDKIHDSVKNNQGIIISLDEEGGVDFKDSSTISSRYPQKLFQRSDLVFLWGQNQYAFLNQNRNNLDESKVIISGHPRFEMLKPAFQKIYSDERNKIKKIYQEYILFNTNMGFGNNIWGDSFVRDNYGSRIKHIETIIRFDKKKIEAYISLIKRISSVYSGNIVLRPHPEENKTTYIEAFRGLENVKVVFEGSVVPWILGAEVMIHPDCTTGIESLMLGKRSISYLPPHENENSCTYLPVKLSCECQTEDEVVDLILNREHVLPEGINDHLLNDYFSFQKDSKDIIVGTVYDLLEKNKAQETKDLTMSYFLKCLVKDTIRPYYMKLRKKDLKLYQNKLKGLDKESVTRTFYEICSMFDRTKQGEIQQVCSNLYRIKRRE